MPLADIVQVSITANGATPTRPGFGTPLIAAVTSAFSPRTMSFTTLSDMVSAGFLTSDPAYLAATKILSQNPRITNFKVGRRLHNYTQTLQITTLSTSTSDTYSFKVGGQQVTLVSTGAVNADAATLTTAISALGITGLTATNPSSPSPNIRLVMTAGKLVDVVHDYVHCSFADLTTDAGGVSGIADDLAKIALYDSNWYGLVLDSNSPAEISAAAAWAEANGPVLFVTNCSDTAIANASSTTDVAYTLKQSAYARTALLFAQTQLLCYSGAAWMGNRFPYNPGSDTWAFKTLAGVPADNLNPAQVHAVEAKNANVYCPVAGLNITQFGVAPGGSFIDVTRFIDWLTAEMQIEIFGTLANNQKIPFTDAGISVIEAVIRGVLTQGINLGGLAASPAPNVFVPTVASINSIDRGNRNIPNVSFTANLAGAVHHIVISGTVSV